jgi:hypothetical protein
MKPGGRQPGKARKMDADMIWLLLVIAAALAGLFLFADNLRMMLPL